ncbi:hypothetical protein RvY_19384, partial [Ramazzottius varieornatus]
MGESSVIRTEESEVQRVLP